MPPFAIGQIRLSFDLSVCLSVCLSVTSWSTAKTVRDRPMVRLLCKACKSPAGYSRDHLQPPTTTSSPQTWDSQPRVKTCITNCGQTVPDTMTVCIDSLWEHTIAQPNSIIVDLHRGTPFPEGGSHCHGQHRPRCKVSCPYTFLFLPRCVIFSDYCCQGLVLT